MYVVDELLITLTVPHVNILYSFTTYEGDS